VKRYERKTIGILGRVKREGSDNKNAAASTASGVVIQLKSLVGPDRPWGNMEDRNNLLLFRLWNCVLGQYNEWHAIFILDEGAILDIDR
jgi:hypothetical protein